MDSLLLPGALRVLVAVGDRDAAVSLCDVARRLGHRVAAVFDGHSAMAAALAFRPHVLLLEQWLPGTGGAAVARHVAAEPALAGTVILAVESLAGAWAEGPDALARALERCTGAGGPAGAAAAEPAGRLRAYPGALQS
jgi:CheY-like chemotaxis protein